VYDTLLLFEVKQSPLVGGDPAFVFQNKNIGCVHLCGQSGEGCPVCSAVFGAPKQAAVSYDIAFFLGCEPERPLSVVLSRVPLLPQI
jgi:hypothetical protein